jgi:hypothetical protein
MEASEPTLAAVRLASSRIAIQQTSASERTFNLSKLQSGPFFVPGPAVWNLAKNGSFRADTRSVLVYIQPTSLLS